MINIIDCICVKRSRDTNNNVISYRLRDCYKQTLDISPENLKDAIRNKRFNVINLLLTKDNRLIYKKNTEKLTYNNKSFNDIAEKDEIVKLSKSSLMDRIISDICDKTRISLLGVYHNYIEDVESVNDNYNEAKLSLYKIYHFKNKIGYIRISCKYYLKTKQAEEFRYEVKFHDTVIKRTFYGYKLEQAVNKLKEDVEMIVRMYN